MLVNTFKYYQRKKNLIIGTYLLFSSIYKLTHLLIYWTYRKVASIIECY